MPDQVGIEAGEEALQTGSRWPRLRLKPNERAVFHCLTTGGPDGYFCATRFHSWGEFPNSRSAVCLRALTAGAETCLHCEAGDEAKERRFALWLWVHSIYHVTDNPAEDGEGWKPTQVKSEEGGKARTLFREEVERPLLLELKAGRDQKWFRQFSVEWSGKGSLQLWLYEFRRSAGEGIDTDYILRPQKQQALPEGILDKDEVKELPPVPDIFRRSRSTPATGPISDGVLGTDSVDGLGEVELPAASMPEADDDVLL